MSSANVHICNHPLIECDMTVLRDKRTTAPVFRATIKNLARCMVYEASRDLKLKSNPTETPLAPFAGVELACSNIILSPILRAGLCMIDGPMEVFPQAQMWHIGLYRDDKTLKPVEYYVKIPQQLPSDATVFILDPMLATGGSAIAAVDLYKQRQVSDIRFLCLIASPEGIQNLTEKHPDIQIYTTSVDERLNDIGYIIPGLGDAGDRAFNTLH